MLTWFLYTHYGVIRKVFRWKRGMVPHTNLYPGETLALMLRLPPRPVTPAIGTVYSFEVVRVITSEQFHADVQTLAGSDLPDLASVEAWNDYLEARIAEQTLLIPPKN